jgi:hypothetical protein
MRLIAAVRLAFLLPQPIGVLADSRVTIVGHALSPVDP